MTSEREVVALVLAAGQGKRMASDKPKVLHEIAGEPMLGFVLAPLSHLREAGSIQRTIAILGHQSDSVQHYLRDGWPWVEEVIQEPQLGTGHAIMQVAVALTGFEGCVLIINGDLPLLEVETLLEMIQEQERRKAALIFLTADYPNPEGYGRVIREKDGSVRAIVEHRDASEVERQTTEINVGVYIALWPVLREILGAVASDNDQGEYYLTDAVAAAVKSGNIVSTVKTADVGATRGINSRAELVAISAEWRRRRGLYWLNRQVTVEDPSSSFIGPRVTIGADTVVEPFVQLYGATRIGHHCLIGSHSRLVDALVGSRVTIRSSDVVSSEIGDRSTVGPFARLREHVIVGQDARIGNFVELKSVAMADGAKAAHLTYLGDAQIGKKANVGCGTITCNFDGERKHRTIIGAHAFVGSNSILVAPVEIGEYAYTAAGSTITHDVPPGSLALGRARQIIKEGWVGRRAGVGAASKPERG